MKFSVSLKILNKRHLLFFCNLLDTFYFKVGAIFLLLKKDEILKLKQIKLYFTSRIDLSTKFSY